MDDENRIARAEAPKTIEELFVGYDEKYTPEEIDWGEPVGKEKW